MLSKFRRLFSSIINFLRSLFYFRPSKTPFKPLLFLNHKILIKEIFPNFYNYKNLSSLFLDLTEILETLDHVDIADRRIIIEELKYSLELLHYESSLMDL